MTLLFHICVICVCGSPCLCCWTRSSSRSYAQINKALLRSNRQVTQTNCVRTKIRSMLLSICKITDSHLWNLHCGFLLLTSTVFNFKCVSNYVSSDCLASPNIPCKHRHTSPYNRLRRHQFIASQGQYHNLLQSSSVQLTTSWSESRTEPERLPSAGTPFLILNDSAYQLPMTHSATYFSGKCPRNRFSRAG